MRVSRRALLVVLLFVTAWLGWTHVSESMEVVTLLSKGSLEDYYTRLWIVDDADNHTWVRAERPDREWLQAVRQNPNVTLWRGGQRYLMRAVILNHGANDHVDRLFRAKYGAIDAIAGFLWRRHSVPIRLERR